MTSATTPLPNPRSRGMRRGATALLCLMVSSLGACQLSFDLPPDGEYAELAEMMLDIGHPTADFVRARVENLSVGCFGPPATDLEIDYTAWTGTEHRMRVRLEVRSTDPCDVSTTVLSDSNPIHPYLLDNSVANAYVGSDICSLLRG